MQFWLSQKEIRLSDPFRKAIILGDIYGLETFDTYKCGYYNEQVSIHFQEVMLCPNVNYLSIMINMRMVSKS